MYKIRKVKFVNHPILKNLELDFCGPDGYAVDTVIFAGENGTGKSTILNCLYDIAISKYRYEIFLEVEKNGEISKLNYQQVTVAGNKSIWVNDSQGVKAPQAHNEFTSKYAFAGIFSDVDINFHAESITSVTSMSLDATSRSRRSDNNFPKQIKQLLIDIQALDDGDISRACRANPNKPMSDLQVKERMPRFTTAFNRMFDDLTYSRIENVAGNKSIIFQKKGVDIPIDSLSSGEKQVVYRGCFLLKDVNATNGAFVFIDEPEISLHPSWQMKIMDYYKGIFTGEDGIQTSQIFAVTHSPFVIHNENRRNDKVIVLSRNDDGDIVVTDKPEYFKCNSVEAVQDAFLLKAFSADQPTVYLEGRTDEKYFNRAVQAYGLSVPFRFKWVGYLDDRGQETNTGDKSVDAAYQFLVAQNLPVRNICLKDCDTNREPKKKNNAIILAIPPYQNSCGMKKGIENALVLDGIDLTPYYILKITTGDYAEKKEIQTFDKMACCDGICAMDDDILKGVFVNLKTTIDRLVDLYNEE